MLAEKPARPRSLTFEGISLAQLGRLGQGELDGLPFGVIGLTPAGEVKVYNAEESRLAGLRPSEILGTRFFVDFGRCMNNQRVAGRLATETELDEIVDHVLTFRLKVIPARLRLLASASSRLNYLLVQR